MNFVTAIPETLALHGVGRIFFGRTQIVERTCVGFHSISAAAKQFMDSQPSQVSQQIPQCKIDHAQEVPGDLETDKPLPYFFPIQGILANQDRSDNLIDKCPPFGQQTNPIAVEVATEAMPLDTLVSGNFDDRLNYLSVGLGLPIRKVVNRRCKRDSLNVRDLYWVTAFAFRVLGKHRVDDADERLIRVEHPMSTGQQGISDGEQAA